MHATSLVAARLENFILDARNRRAVIFTFNCVYDLDSIATVKQWTCVEPQKVASWQSSADWLWREMFYSEKALHQCLDAAISGMYE